MSYLTTATAFVATDAAPQLDSAIIGQRGAAGAAPFNYRDILPKNRRNARAAVEIFDGGAPIEQRAVDAFKLVNNALTDVVGQDWWCISKKTVADETAARMGTIAPSTVARIAQLAGRLPIVDVGFGYGQVIWQLQMIGANVIGGVEMEPTYVDVAINMQRTVFSALAARCAAVSFECNTMNPSWICLLYTSPSPRDS